MASATDRLEEVLRNRVWLGTLKPGSVVVEPELAKEFGVSKTPVREALQRLVAQGQVTVLPKKGYLIRTMGLSDVLELVEMRTVIEPHIAAKAARRRHGLEVLRRELDLQHELLAPDPAASLEHGRAFHETLASAAGNARMLEALERSLEEMGRAYNIVPGAQAHLHSEEELVEHEAIYAAVAAGDPDAARQAMLDHLQSIRQALVSQFTE
ncbi:GntR family transcriptional regulator [Arthrobacter crystallopoietes BAB-32]|uniref:GntR family transcriptional regulator n=1 Tax=Arthrobacter crystallopoietes BAB-32 TaxID=1246476 RepID=N1UZ92_9MICC|nr:GntR family transcriptional regulator [Arthrobacter crystallopoietes]EMY35716.1 GntR family transcriptional regulator [Arthrobacter crystallopoietes BAB-32]